MTAIWAFLVAHHVAILSALGTILTASVANRWAIKHPRVETWLHVLVGIVSFLERGETAGWFKWPLTLADAHDQALNALIHAIGSETTKPAPAPLPPPPAAIILAPLFLALLSAFMAVPARADGLSSGPTVPLVRIDFTGAKQTAVLGAGAGYAVSYGFFPKVIAGHSYDLLSIEGAAFLGHGAGVTSAAAAALVCTFQGLLCAGGGRDLYVSAGAASWFGLVSLGFNFSLGGGPGGAGAPSTSPVVGVPAPVASAPPPGNTVILSW